MTAVLNWLRVFAIILALTVGLILYIGLMVAPAVYLDERGYRLLAFGWLVVAVAASAATMMVADQNNHATFLDLLP